MYKSILSLIIAACVPFPDPGLPKIMTLSIMKEHKIPFRIPKLNYITQYNLTYFCIMSSALLYKTLVSLEEVS